MLGRLALPPGTFPHSLVVKEIRLALDQARVEIRAGREPGPLVATVLQALQLLQQPSLKRVINATGVVLHTNLGRAPLTPFAPIDG